MAGEPRDGDDRRNKAWLWLEKQGVMMVGETRGDDGRRNKA